MSPDGDTSAATSAGTGTELRRLHASNQALLEALKTLLYTADDGPSYDAALVSARAAINAALVRQENEFSASEIVRMNEVWRHRQTIGLAQQPPAFYGFLDEDACCVHLCFSPSTPRHDGTYATAYYTSPPAAQRKPLSIKEINEFPSVKDRFFPASMNDTILRIIRDVERAHGIGEQD